MESFEEEEEELSNAEDHIQHFEIKVDKGQGMARLDKFLAEKIPNASRNKVQQGIEDAIVKVNGEKVKANYKIKPGDVITYWIADSHRNMEVEPEPIPLDILYEDNDLLVVNKPAGMVVHPAHGNWKGTLVNALVHYFGKLPEMPGNTGRPGLVHRIDKDTSGLLVVAKSEEAMTKLAAQFFHHDIKRSYLALVWGEPKDDSGTIDVPIGRSLKNRKVMDAYPEGEHGKHAVTHYTVIQRLRYVSLIECRLETGRTHQIRAHMKYLGHPLFNDTAYGGDKIRKGTQFSKYKAFVHNCFSLIPRQALHAQSLGFVHPITQENLYFKKEMPEDMSQVLEKWRNYVKEID